MMYVDHDKDDDDYNDDDDDICRISTDLLKQTPKQNWTS